MYIHILDKNILDKSEIAQNILINYTGSLTRNTRKRENNNFYNTFLTFIKKYIIPVLDSCRNFEKL